jgi:hypothetical protein
MKMSMALSIYCMLYLENYNDRDQEMDIQIDKVS